jgi:hypothetical protein
MKKSRSMKTRKTWAAAALAAGLAVVPFASQATLAMRLTDGVTTITIVAGAITFIGSIGSFSFNVSSALGDAINAFTGIHLDSLNNSSGVGFLQISMTESGINSGADAAAGAAAVQAFFGGVTGGTVQARFFVDDSNTLFGQSAQIYDSGVLGGGAFAATGGGLTSLTDPYSMTMVADITHLQAATTSFNLEARVPEPATLALVGIGLLGIGAAGRKRAEQSTKG